MVLDRLGISMNDQESRLVSFSARFLGDEMGR
jgi:hypothetical protein